MVLKSAASSLGLPFSISPDSIEKFHAILIHVFDGVPVFQFSVLAFNLKPAKIVTLAVLVKAMVFLLKQSEQVYTNPVKLRL